MRDLTAPGVPCAWTGLSPPSPCWVLRCPRPPAPVLGGDLTCPAVSQANLRSGWDPFWERLAQTKGKRRGEPARGVCRPTGSGGEEGVWGQAVPEMPAAGGGGWMAVALCRPPLWLEPAAGSSGEGELQRRVRAWLSAPLAMATRERGQDVAVAAERGRCCLQAARLRRNPGRAALVPAALDTCPPGRHTQEVPRAGGHGHTEAPGPAGAQRALCGDSGLKQRASGRG